MLAQAQAQHVLQGAWVACVLVEVVSRVSGFGFMV